MVLGQLAADSMGSVYATANRAGDLLSIATPSSPVVSQSIGPGAQGLVAPLTDGSVYVVNQTGGVLQHIAGASATTIASSPLLQSTLAMTFDPSNQTFYLTDPTHNRIIAATLSGTVSIFAGNGAASESDGVLSAASFNAPSGIGYDPGSNALFVTDANGNTVREIEGF